MDQRVDYKKPGLRPAPMKWTELADGETPAGEITHSADNWTATYGLSYTRRNYKTGKMEAVYALESARVE